MFVRTFCFFFFLLASVVLFFSLALFPFFFSFSLFLPLALALPHAHSLLTFFFFSKFSFSHTHAHFLPLSRVYTIDAKCPYTVRRMCVCVRFSDRSIFFFFFFFFLRVVVCLLDAFSMILLLHFPPLSSLKFAIFPCSTCWHIHSHWLIGLLVEGLGWWWWWWAGNVRGGVQLVEDYQWRVR